MKIQSKRNFRYPPMRVKFQSLKLGKTIICNSKLESDFVLLLEFDEDVLSYQIRPFCIDYKVEGKPRKFTPRFLLEKTDSQRKAVWFSTSSQKQAKEKQNFRLLSNFCLKNGIQLEIIDGEEIRRQPRLNNCRLLWRFSRVEIETPQILLCSEFFESNPIPTFNELLAYLKLRNLSYALAFALLFRKVIEFDLNGCPLNEKTLLRLGKNFPLSSKNAQPNSLKNLKGGLRNERS